MNDSSNYYRVYKHVVDGETIYIGCGDPSRPYNLYNRTDKWFEIVNGRQVEVSIVASFDINEHVKASNLESMLIASEQPVVNVRTPDNISPSGKSASDTFRRGFKTVIKNTGISARQASLNAGFNENQLNRFISGKTDIKLNTLDRLCESGFGLPMETVYRMGQ